MTPTHGTRWPPIAKPSLGWVVAPNLLNYERTCAEFSWDDARECLDGLPGGLGLNIAHEAIDRHADGRLRIESRSGGYRRAAPDATSRTRTSATRRAGSPTY
jgi:hypothetical protein